MSLLAQKILFVDCQTTGTSPANGQIIELAWAICSAADENPNVHSYLVALPEGRTLSAITTEITGITDLDMRSALPAEEVKRKFEESIGSHDTCLIHYAQFEKVFLKPFLGGPGCETLPFEVLCTSRLAKKLVPSIPNFNIRGVAGYYGMSYHDLQRAADHVRATILIWRGLAEELEKRSVRSLEDVRALLGEKPVGKKAKSKFEFRITREFRLGLPDRPGIYKMKDKSGHILYVGKASSLYDRVNSYFRGQTGRDKRKLQMLAQTWEMDIRECKSALEAAVTETDEIKKYDPPYNVSLKSGRRELAFYDREFSKVSLEQNEVHHLGPFSLANPIEEIRWILDWRQGKGALTRAFYGLYERELLEEGYQIFAGRHPCDFQNMNLRSHLAFGFSLWRKVPGSISLTQPLSKDLTDSPATADDSDVVSPTDIADKFERLYIRAAQALHRARMLTRLLNSDVGWDEPNGRHNLAVRQGRLFDASDFDASSTPPATPKIPWADKDLADYDRMSVLYSELKYRDGDIRFI